MNSLREEKAADALLPLSRHNDSKTSNCLFFGDSTSLVSEPKKPKARIEDKKNGVNTCSTSATQVSTG